MSSNNYNSVINILHQNNQENKENNQEIPLKYSLKYNKFSNNLPIPRIRTYTDSDQRPILIQPPLQERKKHHFIAISIGGTLLTLNAGFINAVTGLNSGLFTSHVSGTYTHAGISIQEHNKPLFTEYFMLIICYMFGSFLCSLIVPYQTFYLGRAYNLVFMLGTLFLTISAILGILLPGNPTYAYFVAIACGMQNAMTTGYSGSVLRTTHMTGMTTDVGIILGKLAKGDRKDLWKLAMFLPMMAGFMFGGAIGAQAFQDLGTHALIMNVVLYAGTGTLYVFYISLRHRISFLTALIHGRDLKPVEKNEYVPHEENIDEIVALENIEHQHNPLNKYGNGFDNDSEVDEADLTIHEGKEGEEEDDDDDEIEINNQDLTSKYEDLINNK